MKPVEGCNSLGGDDWYNQQEAVSSRLLKFNVTKHIIDHLNLSVYKQELKYNV